jgi:hypothetical protein
VLLEGILGGLTWIVDLQFCRLPLFEPNHAAMRRVVTRDDDNKMVRIIWALLVKQENYRAPVAAKA